VVVEGGLAALGDGREAVVGRSPGWGVPPPVVACPSEEGAQGGVAWWLGDAQGADEGWKRRRGRIRKAATRYPAQPEQEPREGYPWYRQESKRASGKAAQSGAWWRGCGVVVV